MNSECDKWAKRHCFPVDLGEGVTGYVRPMSFKQMRVDDKLDSNERTVWYLACCLCDEQGQPLITRGPEEELKTFLDRVMEFIGEWDSTTIRRAMDAITKVINPTELDTLVKN